MSVSGSVSVAAIQLQSCQGDEKKRVSLVVVVIGKRMGCGVSKVDDLPLVVLCRERKELIRAASDHRYALAVAHISYFRSLRDVGDALCRFVEEELVVASSSSASSPSSLSSPVITIPSDEGKGGGRRRRQRRRELGDSAKGSSPSTSLSHSGSNGNSKKNRNRNLHRKGEVEDGEGEEEEGGQEMEDSHIHISSTDHSEGESSSGHIQIEESPERAKHPSPTPGITYSPTASGIDYTNPYNYYNPYHPYDNPYNAFDSGSYSYGAYYMKKSSPPIPSMIYEEPKPNPIYSYSDYNQSNQAYGNAGYFGFTRNSIASEQGGSSKQQQQRQQPPPTPPSPKVSAWDFLNPFDIFDNSGYHSFYENARYGYGSNTSSPDSRELREREGIPELEEEPESEVIKEVYAEEEKKKKKVAEDFTKLNQNKNKNKSRNVHFADGRANGFGEGTSKGVPLQHQQQPPKAQQPQQQQPKPKQLHTEEDSPVEVKEVTSSSPNSDVSTPASAEEVYLEKKGVTFEMDGAPQHDVESSKFSSLSTLSAHGTRDLREVVREIKDEFEAATDYGKEVCQLLEAGKLPYRSKSAFLRAILSRMLCPVGQSVSASQPQYRVSALSGSSVARMARAYAGDPGNGMESPSLVSTLDKLYVWEKKLYKEVKDEERLRVLYEKKCKKLKLLDDQGAEASKMEATQASIRKLLTRINVSIRSVEAIARRIHQLRDKELQPQLRELIHGLRRMWKLMLKSHQKQFQAILQSKIGTLKANTGSNRDSSVRATVELEMELLKWCNRFNDWIESQKSYVESLNGWLSRCLIDKPEETPDGPMPYSPGRIGAPPVFVICHDWKQAMERVTQSGVSQTVVKTAMNDFATSLHQLWERQDEEQHQRLKAEYTLKDFEKQIRAIRLERAKMNGQDGSSDKGNLSMVPSENGLSALDDLKVDLDSMKQRVKEERVGHKNAIKLVNAAVSRSIQEGLIPIFEALESFTSQAVKAYDHVRVNGASDNQ